MLSGSWSNKGSVTMTMGRVRVIMGYHAAVWLGAWWQVAAEGLKWCAFWHTDQRSTFSSLHILTVTMHVSWFCFALLEQEEKERKQLWGACWYELQLPATAESMMINVSYLDSLLLRVSRSATSDLEHFTVTSAAGFCCWIPNASCWIMCCGYVVCTTITIVWHRICSISMWCCV